MKASLIKVAISLLSAAYGLFGMGVLLLKSVTGGFFFRRHSKQEIQEVGAALDRFWNLSKTWAGYSHGFVSLRDGFKFHYVTNDPVNHGDDGNTDAGEAKKAKPLVVLIHGFPDSWVIWRHLLQPHPLRDKATLVAVDLPGYGGSDRLSFYSATQVLELLTEFIIVMRERCHIDRPVDGTTTPERVIIVGHDVGCVLATRLAAEASELADRFILVNGPLIPLVESNVRRLLSSSLKMFRLFLNAPWQHRSMLRKAICTVKPVLEQCLRAGFIFTYQLPRPLVYYLCTANNLAVLRSSHRAEHGEVVQYTICDAAEALAATVGPAAEQRATWTKSGERYSEPTARERPYEGIMQMTRYFSDGTVRDPWQKSAETVAALHSLRRGNELGRRSSSAAVFDDGPPGALRARSTIVWGLKDRTFHRQICLDGIRDYLVSNSQVILLPRSGHSPQIESESRIALRKVIEWAVMGEKGDVGDAAQKAYSGAVVSVRT